MNKDEHPNGWRLDPGRPVKYTEDFVTGELKYFLRLLEEDSDLVYKGQLFLDRDYSIQRLSEWKTNFADCQYISETIKKIEEILETRAVERGLHSKGNTTFLIFFMKNQYGWKDVHENVEKKIITLKDIKNASNEELTKIAESISEESKSRVGEEGVGEKKAE